jgi:hypothetical protein
MSIERKLKKLATARESFENCSVLAGRISEKTQDDILGSLKME